MTEFDAAPIDTPPLSLVQRLVGALFSPRPTYESVAQHPRWLGVLAVAARRFAMSCPCCWHRWECCRLPMRMRRWPLPKLPGNYTCRWW